MFTKVYEKVLEYIKKEYKFLILLILTTFILTFKLPCYIDIPGGIVNISDRISISESKKLEGTLNFAYVSEMRATIPTYIIAKINPDWDIIKKEQVILENETEKEAKFRDNLSLKESVSNAIYSGFKEANVEFEKANTKIYVTYLFEESQTNLKIGDQIIKIDDKEIRTKEDLKYLNDEEEGKIVSITVINNNKESKKTARLIKAEGKTIIGIGIGETYDIKSEYDIDISYKAKESGPSGGMMMALTTYSYLTKEDLTKGKTIVGTGTIDEEGNIGEIGGVKYKLIGAVKNNAEVFLVPNGENYLEAIKIKEEKNYDIKIIGISTLKETIELLKNN